FPFLPCRAFSGSPVHGRKDHRMESIIIRPFVETDIATARAIAAAIQPPHLATEGLTLLRDVYRVSADRHCLAAEGNGGKGVLGIGALWRVRAAKFRLDVMVHPRRQRGGIGGALL